MSASPGRQCECTDAHFTPARAQSDLVAYRRRGPTGTARLMLQCLGDVRLSADSLLDVGAGIGVLHHELLDAGVGTAVHLEVARAYVEAAREESTRRGHDGRVHFRHGDVVGLVADLAAADLVTLDRVVCCYHDLDALMEASTRKANRYYALSFPRDRWYVRGRTWWKNLRRRRAGDPFRFFVHPVARIRSLIAAAGFDVRCARSNLNWEVLVWERRAGESGL